MFITCGYEALPPFPPKFMVCAVVAPVTAVPIFITCPVAVLVLPSPIVKEELKRLVVPVVELAILTVPEVSPVLNRAKVPVVTEVVIVGEFSRVVEAPVPPRVKDTVAAVNACTVVAFRDRYTVVVLALSKKVKVLAAVAEAKVTPTWVKLMVVAFG